MKSSLVWVPKLMPLILVLALCSFGFLAVIDKLSVSIPPSFAYISNQAVLILHDRSDPGGELAHGQTVAALEYAKVNFESLDLSETTVLPDMERYASIATTTEFISKLDSAECDKISEFVHDGGGLAVLYRGWNPNLSDVFGIANTDHPEFVVTNGVKFRRDLQPGIKDEELGGQQYLALSATDEPVISCLDVDLVRGTEIVAESARGEPLAWSASYGSGRVIYWNADWLSYKRARGLIVQSILSTQQVGAQAIANVGIFQVDDFPAATANVKLFPVDAEYDLDLPEFYAQVWYPDMVSLGRRFDLDYTWLTIFTYNAIIKPPFPFAEWEVAKIRVNDQDMPWTTYAAHQVLQWYEMGFHGYNHLSLTLHEWDSQQDMVLALLEAKERWLEDDLGPLPFSYVPPHNNYDETGIKALIEALPSIKVVSGLYLGTFEEGGDREFGPEPWADQVFSIPRMSSGYFLTPDTRLMILGGLNTLGSFTHFIHPDDLFDNPVVQPDTGTSGYGGTEYQFEYRNPHSLPWRGDYDGDKDGFYYEMEQLLEYVQRHYPWLRHMSTQDAYHEFQDYFATDVFFSFAPHEMTVNLTHAPAYFQVRINDGRRIDLSELDDCQFIHVYEGEGYDFYTFKAVEEEVALKFIMPVK